MKHVIVGSRRAVQLATRKHEQTGYSYNAVQVCYDDDSSIAWVPAFLVREVGLLERVKERVKAL